MATKKRNGKGHDITTGILIEIRDEIRAMRAELDAKVEGLRGEMAGVRTELKILTARDAISTDARLARIEKDVEDLKRART